MYNNKDFKVGELKKEDTHSLNLRTAQLFEVISMCENEEDKKICENEIIENNVRLVTHVARKYKPFGEDEFQTGCIGLIIATKTFNPERGVPFSSYACFCIERELHKAHKKLSDSFEYKMADNIGSIDMLVSNKGGDTLNLHEMIEDVTAEEYFDKVLSDFMLIDIFNEIIEPAISKVAGHTRGKSTKVDFNEWKKLEMRYLLELAEIDSREARITLSAMAKELGISIQNTRIRHRRVVAEIKGMCIQAGIEV